LIAAFLATAVLLWAGPARILILVSFDGFRWDYLNRGRSPHLSAMARTGVRADGLIPSFPSKTFPNHYSIVTGLYPAHHGIISNVIADPAFPVGFITNTPTARDPRWWGGEPIWVTAQRQGHRTAPIFWPGSDVAIGGVLPDAWMRYDDAVSNADRVRKA